MTQTFDQKYADVIKEMQKYLLDNHLHAIKFTYTDGWKFSLSIPKKKVTKLSDGDAK